MKKLYLYVVLIFCASINIYSDEINFIDFSDVSKLILNGDTKNINISGPVFSNNRFILRLTNDLWQVGSAFYNNSIILRDAVGKYSFSTHFQFQISNPRGLTDGDGIQGADGIVFVLAAQNNILGGLGGGIGYLGIPKSIGIEIDTWRNSGNPPADPNDGNHIGINLNGSINSITSINISTPLNIGNIWNMWIDYDAINDNLEVRISEQTEKPETADLIQKISPFNSIGGQAYIGFTSATAAGGNDHDILSWNFSSWLVLDQPPQIAHLPVTQAKLGEKITFSFDVTDDHNNITSIVIFFRKKSNSFYDRIIVFPNPDQALAHYDIFLSEATDAIGKIEYYIQATDTQFTTRHGTSNNPHVISIIDSENQPPQITHTPITSAIQGKEIWFSMDVVDDRDQLKTLVIYARITGERDFTPYPFVVSQGQTKYEMGIPGLTQTLDGVEYYIEATDEQGLVGYHRSDDGAHFICVTDPNKKTPIIIIPGIMGSELYDTRTDELLWLDPNKAIHPNDPWLLSLMLQKNGKTPDGSNRCVNDWEKICVNDKECASFACASGGRELATRNVINIEGIYTAYKKLIEFLNDNDYHFREKVFLHSYDWRLDLMDSEEKPNKAVEFLRNMILELTPNCGDKVNIIAHSMGGLVVRSYLSNPKYFNDHRIDTIVYLGTPHQGSLNAYTLLKKYYRLINEKELGVPSVNIVIQGFVSQNFPGVYELLPRYNFVIREDMGVESFEESYKSLSNVELVTQAKIFHQSIQDINPIIRSFAINGSGISTLSYFNIDRNSCISAFSNQGDGTVPEKSSCGFINTNEYFVREKHQALPGLECVQKKILKILERKENEPDDLNEVKTTPFDLKKTWSWNSCSPINISITDIKGNINKKDSETGDILVEIPESQFFVFEHNESGFLLFEDEYNVHIQAKNTGLFTLSFNQIEVDASISYNFVFENVPIIKESKGDILLMPSVDEIRLKLDVEGDGETDFELLPNTEIPKGLLDKFTQRGDINRDRALDISDAISILGYLFLGNTILCEDAINVNNDSRSDISDAIFLLNFLFLGTEKQPYGLVFCK